MKTCLAFCMLVAVAQLGSAQEIRVVTPPGLETKDGSLAVPNDPSTVIRVQEQWSADFFADLPEGGTWLIGLANRLDGAETTATTFFQNIELSVSTSSRETVGLSYAANVGADVVQVYTGSDPGDYSVSADGPNPFGDPLIFDTPFFYDPSKGDLLTDFKVDGGGSFVFDSHDVGRPVAAVGSINGTTADFFVNDHIVTEFIFVVPEPSSLFLALLPLGLGIHFLRVRK